MPHRRREMLKPRWPVHITLRCVRDVGRLRKFKVYQRLREAMAEATARTDFSICHYSVQGDHLHLICEARSNRALANGMRSLKVRITGKLNKLLSREGSVFDGRYHMRILKNPTTVRGALGIRPAERPQTPRAPREYRVAHRRMDRSYSSAYYFDGWFGRPGGRLGEAPTGPPPVADPRTWLLSVGWRRGGLIHPSATPTA